MELVAHRNPDPQQTAIPGEQRAGHSRHVLALDGLRGLAILMVLSLHLGGGRHAPYLFMRVIADAVRIGWAGVSLFFVLSGFLISGILWDSFAKDGWWRRFYRRRSLRIFPLYVLVLVYVVVVTSFVAPGAYRSLWVCLLYLQDFPWFGAQMDQLRLPWICIDQFWSLAVEEQFYLLWPFMLFALRKRREAAIAMSLAIVAISLAFRLQILHLHTSIMWDYISLPARAGELALGAALALALRGSPTERAALYRIIRWTLAVSSAALVALPFLTHGSFETDQPLWLGWGIFWLGVFFACMIALALQPGALQRRLENPVLRWYGKISYGVYVFHPLISFAWTQIAILTLPRASARTVELARIPVVMIASTLLAALSFYTYESYFLRLKEAPSAHRLKPKTGEGDAGALPQ